MQAFSTVVVVDERYCMARTDVWRVVEKEVVEEDELMADDDVPD